MKSLGGLILILFLAAPIFFLALHIWNVSFCVLDVWSPACRSSLHLEKLLWQWEFLAGTLIAVSAFVLLAGLLSRSRTDLFFKTLKPSTFQRETPLFSLISFRLWIARHENSPTRN